MSVRTRVASLVIAVGAAAVSTFALAAPAQAAVGNVYISFPNWLANCPNGGSVKRIWATDGLQTWNWDAGDDLIYGQAYIGRSNSLQYELFCQTSWIGTGYYQPGAWANFSPSRSGQTVWVGPAGVRYN